jgi:hypothetical protein
MRRDSRRQQLSSSDAARLRARAAIAAHAVLAPLRTSVRETQDAVGMLKTLSLLERLLVGLAGACCVVGVVLLLWLLSRVLGAPDRQAPAPTQEAPTTTQQAPTTTQQAPTPAQQATQQAEGPRWGVSVGAMTAVLLAVLVLIAGLAYFAFRRGRFYLLCFCVSLFGAEIIVLESYASIYPVPIFGQFVVLAGLLIAALLFLGRLAHARVIKYAKETQDKVLKQIETRKKELVTKAFEAIAKDPELGQLKELLEELRPQLEKLLLEQIEKMEGPLMEKAEPIIEKLVNLVKAKAYEKTVSAAWSKGRNVIAKPFERAATTAAALGATVKEMIGLTGDADEFHDAKEEEEAEH